MSDSKEKALKMKQALDRQFYQKGIAVAVISGICYGLFTAFLNLGMGRGVWATWTTDTLSAFTVTYIIGALGSTTMYFFSALTSISLAAIQGKLTDCFRSICTKPGRNLMLLGLLSGPLAGTAYVIALQKAGSIVIPITGLCPAIGAILARMLYKQPLGARTILGIVVCFCANVMIAGNSLGAGASENMIVGMVMAFMAAFIWGLEGCVAGYSTAMLDYQIGITLRQFVGVLSNVLVVLPLLSVSSGEGLGYAWHFFGQALTDGASLWAFALSGFFAMFAYSLWFKGNSMCGAALGMACNATYAFWGPLFCWLILGLGFGQAGWDIPLVGWVSAIVMVLGIFIIAVNPLALLKRGDTHDAA